MDLSLFSRHRTSLMGVAAMLIVFCHASGFVPDASPVLKKQMESGNLGVDIFLLLSGIGLFYSLASRTKNIFAWYGHRYLRILVPYLLIADMPLWLVAFFEIALILAIRSISSVEGSIFKMYNLS